MHQCKNEAHHASRSSRTAILKDKRLKTKLKSHRPPEDEMKKSWEKEKKKLEKKYRSKKGKR